MKWENSNIQYFPFNEINIIKSICEVTLPAPLAAYDKTKFFQEQILELDLKKKCLINPKR